MAFVFRGDHIDEETKMRATERLYLLLPNHKCPQKDCPFHPPEEATKEDEELPTETLSQPPKTGVGIEEGGRIVAPPPPVKGEKEEEEKEQGYPAEITIDSGEELLLSDHDSVLTGDSGVGRERDDFSDGEVVLRPVSPEPSLPQLQYIVEDEEVVTLTSESSTLGECSEHDTDDESTTPAFFTPPSEVEEEQIREDAARDTDYTPLLLPVPEPTQPSDYKLQVAPEFTAKLKNKRVPTGLSLHLHCSVTGLPEPRVRWIKDGQEIYSGADYHIKNNYGLLTLEVLAVNSQHGGVYSCLAYNDHGSVSCDATVTIEGEEAMKTIQVEILRPRFLTPLQDLVVQEGDDVTMCCLAAGKPVPDLKWQKDMLEVTNSSRVTVTSDGQGGSMLTIRRVKASDAGLYMVRARSRSGRCQSTATLRVQGGSTRQTSPTPQQSSRHYCFSTSIQPKVKTETPASFSLRLPPSVEVHEGDSLRLDCSVQGYPTPIVSWYKNYRGLMYGPRHRILFVGSLHTLHIPHTMALDSGDYIVRAHNTWGKAESVCTVRLLPPRRSPSDVSARKPPETHATQQIKTAPYFTKTLPSTVELTEGGNFRLDCVLREGIHFVPWPEPQDTGQPSSRHDDTGQLSCSPQDKTGQSQAENKEVSGTQPVQSEKENSGEQPESRSLQFQEPLPEKVEVGEGETVTLTCTVSQPFARISWYKDDNRLSFESQRLGSVREEGGRVSLRVDGVRQSDAGVYRCVATLSDGTQLHSDTRLSVHGSGESQASSDTRQATSAEEMTSSADKGRPPVLVLQHKQQDVEEGQKAKFKVTVASASPSTVTWSCKGQPIEAGPKFKMYEEDGGHCLEICDVSKDDKGTYTVTVNNRAGTDTASAVLNVSEKRSDDKTGHVPSGPAFRSSLHDLDVVIGDRNVKLRCEVDVREGSGCSARWYHDGQEVEEEEGKGYRQMWNGRVASLTIRQIAVEHAGLYQCVVSSAKGQATTSCTLTVREAEKLEPPFFIQELRDLEVEDGDKVELVVEVKDTDLDAAAET